MIEGKIKIHIIPYHDAEHDGTENIEKLKRIASKLKEADIPMLRLNGGIADCMWRNPKFKDKLGRKALCLDVPENDNFWAQLVLIPTIMTPYFWKKSKDELEAERAKLVANNAWAKDNWLKLAEMFDGTVGVHESYDYDGMAEHLTLASAKWCDDDPTGTCFMSEPPDNATALKNQIECIKNCVKQIEASGRPAPVVNKPNYWGMFD